MKNTVATAVRRRGLSKANELVIWANDEAMPALDGLRTAANAVYRARFEKTTAATGVLTTAWTSEAMRPSIAWSVTAHVLARASSGAGRATFTRTALFYRDSANAVQEGATTATVTIRNPAGLDVAFGVSGTSVVLQVQDDGVLTVEWGVLITLDEVPRP